MGFPNLVVGDMHTARVSIPATELAAGTPIDFVWPVDGWVYKAYGIVQTAIVTGGDITFQNVTDVIAGLTLTVANSATKGTIVSDTPNAGGVYRKVVGGTRGQVIPAAAFNGGGAMDVLLQIATSDPNP